MQSLEHAVEEDIWTSQSYGHAPRLLEDAPRLVVSEHTIAPLDDQKGIPFWDQKWIAPDLAALLFAQPDTGATLRTYLIVDATLRQAARGVHDLDADTLELPVRCLFQGGAADELETHAPYLIDMTLDADVLDDAARVPKFHRDYFAQEWPLKYGVFLRSAAPMEAIWKHLRRFTRLRMEGTEKWYFYRFWDPVAATVPLFAYVQHYPQMAAAWFDTGAGADASVTSFIYQDYRDDMVRAARFDLPADMAADLSGASARQGRFDTFTQGHRDYGVRYLMRRRCYDIAKTLQQRFAAELAPYTLAQLETRLLVCTDRMQHYGVRQQEYLTQIFVWDLLIGEMFEARPEFLAVREVFESRKREPMKFDLVRNLMRPRAPEYELSDE